MVSDKTCCVPTCPRRRSSRSVLHSFPNPVLYPERFQSWVTSIRGEILALPSEQIYKYRRICRTHFEQQFWCRNNRLSNIAIPTLNLPGTIIGPTLMVESNRPSHSPSKCIENLLHESPSEGEQLNQETTLNEAISDQICDSSSDDTIQDEVMLKLNSESDVTSQDVDRVFSWEKDEIVLNTESYVESDEFLDGSGNISVLETVPRRSDSFREEVSKVAEPESTIEADTVRVHEGFQCNFCWNPIAGFRYSCLQCANFDLCAGCEGLRAHPEHYMLRIPGLRPFEEIQSVLQSVRSHLFNEVLITSTNLQDLEDSIKMEVKQEVEEVSPLPSTRFLPKLNGATKEEVSPPSSDTDSETFYEEEYLEELDDVCEPESHLQVEDRVNANGSSANLLLSKNINTHGSSPEQIYYTSKRKLESPKDEDIKIKILRTTSARRCYASNKQNLMRCKIDTAQNLDSRMTDLPLADIKSSEIMSESRANERTVFVSQHLDFNTHNNHVFVRASDKRKAISSQNIVIRTNR